MIGVEKIHIFSNGKKTSCLVTLVLVCGVPLESKSINMSFWTDHWSGFLHRVLIENPPIFSTYEILKKSGTVFVFCSPTIEVVFCSSQVSNRFHLWILKASRIWWWQLKYFDYFQPDFWGDDPIYPVWQMFFLEAGWNHMWNHQLEKYCRSFVFDTVSCWSHLHVLCFL